MFLLWSVFAASIDGFVMGFVIKGLGIKLGIKNNTRCFMIIFLCCMGVTLPVVISGCVFDETLINITGAGVMIYLGIKALKSDDTTVTKATVDTVALSVARDGAIVSLYMVLEGYNVVAVCGLCALLHCTMLWLGNRLCNLLIKNKREIYTRYISAGIFFLMAIYKGIELL